MKMGRFTIRTRNALFGYIFILPWILGFLLFTAFPFFYSIFLSMSSVKISPTGIETKWIGLANYFAIFTKDVNFPIILGESIVFVVLSAPMIVVASLIIAILLNGKFKGRSIFRGIFFLPVIIISGPVVAELMTNQAAKIVEPTKYIIYQFFTMLPKTVGAPVLYVFDNLVLILWFSGVQILIFLAGLQKIDTSIYEAAQIDGASSWEVFWKIVLPYVKPLALVNTIYTIVEMSSFPTNKINALITSKMFEMGNVYSYSAAMSWTYFLVEFLLLGIAFLIFKERGRASR
jgi:ABC-type sugar transport system permease subunit